MKKILILSLLAGCSSQPLIENSGKMTINPEFIKEKLHDNISKFRQCYKKELDTNSELSGSINLKFTILDNGSVSNSEVTSDNIKSSTIFDCMKAVSNQIRYPATNDGQSTTVAQPINLYPRH